MAVINLEELHSGWVLRAAKRSGVTPFPNRAMIADFLPSTEDKDRATEGRPVLISVFHATPVLGCLEFLGWDSMIVVCFALEVEDIKKIEAEDKSRRLNVFRDPLPEPLCRRPWAHGHSGISGLGRAPGEAKAIMRDLCSQLVNAAKVAGPEA